MSAESQSKTQSRRQFFAATGTFAAASCLLSTRTPAADWAPQVPWPYATVDPDGAAVRAYEAYYSGKGCMYGAFEGIIGELRQNVGTPYTTFPSAMMEYGKGGVAGSWGTLCGALNGAAAAINLAATGPMPVINELFFWYCQSSLPNYTPPTPKFSIISSVSGSPICHLSVQGWCAISGFKPTSPERAERCACLTASVAKYTARLLNAQAGGTFSQVHQKPDEVQQCMSCHGPNFQANVHHGSNMGCVQCHSEVDSMHPQPHLTVRWTGKNQTLESADAVTGAWAPAASQSNPQPVPTTGAAKFFRLK